MRLPLLWYAFWLLFVFWLVAFFFHLRGGLTTYALLVTGIALFLRRTRVDAR